MLAGYIPTLRIDLNRLRGNRVVTSLRYVEDGWGLVFGLGPGDFVRVVEEEGDAYLAAVERIDGELVYLELFLSTWQPAHPLHQLREPPFSTSESLRLPDQQPQTSSVGVR
jgi:hypothetical protein